jgi:hypothetical protein
MQSVVMLSVVVANSRGAKSGHFQNVEAEDT